MDIYTSPPATASCVITPVAPYDFGWALAYLRSSPSAILETIDSDAGTYQRALRLAGRDVVLSLRATGTVAHPKLVMNSTDADVLVAAEQTMRRIFHLDVDPTPFLAVVAGDPVLARLVQRFAGLRPVLIASPYEALLWAIIGQQINVTFAAKLKRTLIDLCGDALTVAGTTYRFFPTPATVAALDPQQLRDRQFSQQKTAYLIGVSQAIATGTLDLAAIAALPFDDAVNVLTAHKGIGRWTAEYVLMRGLGTRDSIPAADIGLRAVIGRAYDLGRKASETEVRAYAERWAGWRGWAAFYWWLALQLETTAER